jgi:hypothetical protein
MGRCVEVKKGGVIWNCWSPSGADLPDGFDPEANRGGRHLCGKGPCSSRGMSVDELLHTTAAVGQDFEIESLDPRMMKAASAAFRAGLSAGRAGCQAGSLAAHALLATAGQPNTARAVEALSVRAVSGRGDRLNALLHAAGWLEARGHHDAALIAGLTAQADPDPRRRFTARAVLAAAGAVFADERGLYPGPPSEERRRRASRTRKRAPGDRPEAP